MPLSKLPRRAAGIILPVSSLPGKFGIGDFGPEAHAFVDWLSAAGQHLWQILPLTVPDFVGSPYASPSGSAGNWVLISPEVLVADGLLRRSDLRALRLPDRRVSYQHVIPKKWWMIERSFMEFERHATREQRRRFFRFQMREKEWLEPFTLYQSIKDLHGGKPWWEWPRRFHDPRSASRNRTADMSRGVALHTYAQWVFQEQWDRVRAHAHTRGIRIIGDLPFYVQYDSVEVWSEPDMFMLNKQKKMTVVAGSSPTVFHPLGQKWGMPLFRWPTHKRTKYRWWIRRIGIALKRYDIVRLDHFRGFAATWNVPIRAKYGKAGYWVKTPGRPIIHALTRRFGNSSLFAEDLGQLTTTVDSLLSDYNLDRSRVFQFAWTGLPNNFHHPDFVKENMYYYTANHDTNTTYGWLRTDAKAFEVRHVRDHYGKIPPELNWVFLEEVYRHKARVAMSTLPDILGLGSDGRLNKPGTKRRTNWSWRLPPKTLTPALARRLRTLARRTGRL